MVVKDFIEVRGEEAVDINNESASYSKNGKTLVINRMTGTIKIFKDKQEIVTMNIGKMEPDEFPVMMKIVKAVFRTVK